MHVHLPSVLENFDLFLFQYCSFLFFLFSSFFWNSYMKFVGWSHVIISYVLGGEFFFFLCFLGPCMQHMLLWATREVPCMQHMEVPRLRVESELQLLATATATWDLSHVCDLHHSSLQHWILDPLSETRDQTWNLMDTSRIHFCWATIETP